MKKNLIALLSAAVMVVSSAAVFADEPVSDEVQILENVNVISSSYISNTVTVTEVTEEKISTTLNADDAENPENTVNYTVSENTVVLGYANGDVKKVEDIKKGDKITVYSNAYAPAPLILPPQYQADVIFVEDNAEIDSLRMVDVDTYVKNEEGELVNVLNTLQINLGENTVITGLKGKMVTQDELDKKDLAVIYSTSTRSIPAQTTPIAIYVLGENEQALAQLEAANNEATPAPEVTPEVTVEPTVEPADYTTVKTVSVNGTVITNVYTKGTTLMVPLRAIAETLGYTVEWDGTTKSIMLNSGMYSLKIGENSYIKGKMMPMTLASEPELKLDDLTYVPIEFFSEVLEESNSIILNFATLTLNN